MFGNALLFLLIYFKKFFKYTLLEMDVDIESTLKPTVIDRLFSVWIINKRWTISSYTGHLFIEIFQKMRLVEQDTCQFCSNYKK